MNTDLMNEKQRAAFNLLPARTRNAVQKFWDSQAGDSQASGPALPPCVPVVPAAARRPIARPKPERTSPAALFAACVGQLYNEGLLVAGPKSVEPPAQVADGVFVATAPEGWGPVAADFASQLGGQGRPSPANVGAAWQLGRNVSGVVVDRRVYRSLLLAQAIVQNVIPGAPAKWSLGACARQLFAYVGPPQQAGHRVEAGTPWANGKRYVPGNADRLLEGITYGYHSCRPGRYEYAEHYDVSGFYFHMLTKLRSLYLTIYDDGFDWEPMPPDAWDRWQAVLAAVPAHKPLRNALAGAAAGATWGAGKNAIAYSRIKGAAPAHKADPWPVRSFDLPRSVGPFRAAGLLLVRTGYEKTCQQCLEQDLTNPVLYSNIDSIVCLPNRVPVWERFGFAVKNLYSGPAHIISRGNWKIGGKQTLNYQDGTGEPIAAAGETMPPVLYGTWLEEAS